jgi:hypothetical protein
LKLSSEYNVNVLVTAIELMPSMPHRLFSNVSVKWSWNCSTGLAANTVPGSASTIAMAAATATARTGRTMPGLLCAPRIEHPPIRRGGGGQTVRDGGKVLAGRLPGVVGTVSAGRRSRDRSWYEREAWRFDRRW